MKNKEKRKLYDNIVKSIVKRNDNYDSYFINDVSTILVDAKNNIDYAIEDLYMYISRDILEYNKENLSEESKAFYVEQNNKARDLFRALDF
jgi:hypothetical protein